MSVIALFLFATADYFGYGYFEKKVSDPAFYMIFRPILLLIAIALLCAGCSFRDALVFVLLWWTWTADLLYYGLALLTDGFRLKWMEGRVAALSVFRQNQITWAWWTPLGLARGLSVEVRAKSVNKWWLFLQCAIGILVTWAIS